MEIFKKMTKRVSNYDGKTTLLLPCTERDTWKIITRALSTPIRNATELAVRRVLSITNI